MRAVGLPRAALLGNSFGCQIAVACAERHPAVVDRLVLQGPTADPASRSVIGIALRWLMNSRARAVEFELSAVGVPQGRISARGRYLPRDAARPDGGSELPKVEAPVLVVRGDRDPLCPRLGPNGSRHWRRMADLVVVPGAAHTMNHYQVEQLAQLVEPFLCDWSAG